MAKDFWNADPVDTKSAPDAGGDFWLTDPPAAQQDLPADVRPSLAGAGRGFVAPPTSAPPEQQPRFQPDTTAAEYGDVAQGLRDAPSERPVSVLQTEGMTAPNPQRRLSLGAGPINQQTAARAEQMVDGQDPGPVNRPVVERAAAGLQQQVDAGQRDTFGAQVERTQQRPTQELATQRTADEWRSVGEWANDTGAALVSGAVSLAQLPVNIIAPGSALSESLQKSQENLQDFESEPMKARRQELADRVNGEEGFLDQYAATVAELVSNPSVAIHETMRQAAMFAGVLTAARGGAAAAQGGVALAGRVSPTVALGEAISGGSIAARAGAAGATAGGVAANTTMAAGDAAGNAYEKLMSAPPEMWEQSEDFQDLVAKGMGPKAAKQEIATAKARTAAMIAAPLGLLGFMGAEASFVSRGAGRAGGQPLRMVVTEMVTEPVEEALTQVAGNYAAQTVNPDQSLGEGAGEAAGMATVTSGPFAAAGAINEMRKPIDRTEQIKGLRASGDATAADMLKRRFDREMATYNAGSEAQKLATFGPQVQERYQTIRMAGAQPGDAVVKTAIQTGFEQAAQMAGLSPKARAALEAKLEGMPPDKAPAVVQKYITALADAGAAQPFVGLDTLATDMESQMDAMLDAVVAGDIAPTLEGQTSETDQTAATEADTAGTGGTAVAEDAASGEQAALDELSEVNDVLVTAETDAVHQAATSPLNELPEPSQAQKDAGNYKVGKIKISGLNISVENPQGSVRRGTDEDGKAWESPLKDHYGYIRGTTAADGDKLDLFIKPGTPETFDGTVFVVDQIDPRTGKFDEAKVVFGAADQAEAEAIYRRNYSADWQGLGAITALPMPEFKAWAASDATKKPLGKIKQQANVQDAPQGTAGTEAQAAPVEARAPEDGDAASAGGVPAATGTGDAQADGVSARLGRDNIPLSEGGRPFKTEKAARTALKQQTGMRVVKADGGFVLAPKTPAQIAAQEKAAKRLGGVGNSGVPMAAHELLASRGGLSKDAMADLGFDRNQRVGAKWLFAANGGMSLERATEALQQAGYMQGTDQGEAIAMIQRSARGNPVYTPEGYEQMARAEAETRFEDHLAAQQEGDQNGDDFDPFAPSELYTDAELEAVGYNDATKQQQDEFDALIAAAEAEGIDVETIREEAFENTRTGTDDDYRNETRTLIEAARSGRSQAGERSSSEQGRQDAEREGSGDGRQGDGAEGSTQSLTLEDRPDGTLAVKGDTKALRERLTAAGIPAKSILPSATGVVVGKTQAKAAREALQPVLTNPTRSEVEAQQDRTEQADKLDQREQVKRESEVGDNSFMTGFDGDGRQDTTSDLFSAPSEPDQMPVSGPDKAKQAAADDLKNALGDLADIFGKNFKANILPEQEQKLLPVLTRVMDAAFRLGYLKFKDAAKFALDKIREALGSDVADAVTLDHLQGAYIAMSGRYQDQGADKKRAVIDIESKEEVESHTAKADNPVSKEQSDAPGTNARVERDSGKPAAVPAMGDPVSPGARRTAQSDDQAGGQAGRGGRRGQSDALGVPSDGTTAGGERGDQRVPAGNGPAVDADIAAGTDFRERGSDIGITGIPPETVPAAQVAATAVTGDEDGAKRSEQRRADAKPVKTGDLANIRETLPYLLDGQQTDVHLAETQFAKPDGYGMLFTNGTGTGKTFSGLGVVKRFARQGKTETLIVVPDDKIAADWIESARALGLTVTKLESTKDAGRGISITTYANLGENDALATRRWDLVVSDEAHTLMQSADGKVTGYLENLRAITHHPDGTAQRYTMLNRPDLDRMKAVSEQITANEKIRNRDDTMDVMRASLEKENVALEAERKALQEKLSEALKAVRADVAQSQGLKRTRAVFLSATPFAYEKTIDWANGYLFDYNEGQGQDGASGTGGRPYNSGSNRERFFMQHFGYSMRYNKLTEPDGRKVDRGLMQRQFNGYLKKRGALSGRMLDVKADYDRRFVLVESAVGNKIDEAIDWIETKRRAHSESFKDAKGTDTPVNGYDMLQADLRNKLFGPQGHLVRRYMLEAIKAKEVIPLVKQHMALGRKVVVFHDFKKNEAINPFIFGSMPEVKGTEGMSEFDQQQAAEVAKRRAVWNQAVNEFNSQFPELTSDNNLLRGLQSPIVRFSAEIPGTLLINGDEKKSDLLARYKEFNKDERGPMVALVQSAKNKGWSGHDTTGKHQRVLFNLGLPTQPTMAIQQEGRIYRTGQVSDALFRYLNTGTNWERWAFAQTIADRASAAENLGMGELSRALKDSFISAFEEADSFPPGHEGEGKGGKERDKAANNALSAWDRSKTFYWGTQKKNSRTKAQEGVDYFATPEPVGLKMVEWLSLRGGEDSLEPSAGHGAIARWLPETTKRTVIEPSSALRSRLAMVMNPAEDRMLDGQFENLDVVNKFDGIVMNPPFGSGGKTAIDHLAKAATHLRDGGRIVALIPTGPAADKKFDKWFYESEQRPVKPLATHPDFGPIYVGDTIKSRASWAPTAVVVRMNQDGKGYLVKVPGSPAGQLTSITAESITGIESTGKRTREVRPSESLHLAAEIKMPRVTFERAGTAVATRIVVIEKQTDATRAPKMVKAVDLSGITKIEELFDRLEDLSINPRSVTKAQEEAAGQESKESAPTKAVREKPVKAEVVPSVDRAGAKVVEHTTAKGKVIRGIIRTDLTKEEAQKIDPYTWKKDGGFFIREKYLKPDTQFAVDDAGQDGDTPSNGTPDTRPEARINIGVLGRDIAAYLGIPQREFDAVHPYDARVLQGAGELQKIADAFGSEVQGFGVRAGLGEAQRKQYGFFGGVRTSGILFLRDQGADRPHLAVLGHELGHQLRTQRPDLYNQLVDAIQPFVDVAKYEAAFVDSVVAKNQTTADKKQEEFIGEVLSDGFMDGDFWRALGKKNPSLLQYVGDFVFDLIDKAMKALGYTKRSAPYLTDYQAVMRIAGEVMAEYGVAPRNARGDLAFQTIGSTTAKAPAPSPLTAPAKPAQMPLQVTQGNQPPRAPVPVETRARAAQRVIQDQFNRFTVIRNWAKEQGMNLSQISDVWGFEERMHGRIATRIEDFREKRVQPLIQRIQKAGFTMPQVAEYLHAQHAEERNKQILSIDPTNPAGSGMTTANAQTILAAAKPELVTLANEFRQIADDTKGILLTGGIISQEMVDAWDKTYKHYVPLKGGDQDTQPIGTGKGLSVKATNKRALGHGERSEFIVENMLRDHERAVMLVEKNRVGHSLLAMTVELGRDDIATFGQPERRKVLKNATSFEVVGKNGAVVGTFDTQNSANLFIVSQKRAGLTVRPVKGDPVVSYMASPMLAENEVQVYVKGQTVRIQLNDPLLARGYKKLGVEHLGRVMQVNREINGFLSKAYTGYNPEFFIKNVLRDFTSGLINITGQEGALIAAKAAARYPKAFGQMLRYSFSGGKKASPSIQAYRHHGGTTGAAYLSDIERVGADIQSAYDKYQGAIELARQGRPWKAVNVAGAKLVRMLIGFMEHLNAAGENAMRLAVFDAVRNEPGRTIQEAASLAKNSTVNFNRKGEMGAQANALYLFFNAAMQGTAATLDALLMAKHKHQAQFVAGALGALAYSMAALQFGGDDDEDREAWAKIPDYVKDRNLVIRTGEDTYITLSVPYGYGFFFTLGNAAFDLQRGADKQKIGLKLASGLVEHFGPAINPISGDDLDPKGMVELVPGLVGGEIMRAGARLIVNRSGLGSEIVPESPFDEGKPDNLKTYRSTKGTGYEAAANMMSQITGGTRSQPGGIDVSPETLKFWTQTITGGAGKFVMDTANTATLMGSMLGENDPQAAVALTPEIRELPLVRTVVRKQDIRDTRRVYWEKVKEAEEAQKSFNRAKKMGDGDAMVSLAGQEGHLLALAKHIKKTNEAVKALRDTVELINLSDEYTRAEKRMMVKDLERGEEDLYNGMIRTFEAMEPD